MQHNSEFLSLIEECRPFVKEVRVTDVKEKLEEIKNNKVRLLDVREDEEWNTGHLPYAIHISRGILERDVAQYIVDKKTPIIIYCSGGYRSILAAFNLQKMGYESVCSMAGGVRDWIYNDNELVI